MLTGFFTLLLTSATALTAVAWATVPSAQSRFVIISDIDDTVKITHVLNKKEAIKNGFTGRKVFAGGPELYQAWIANTEAENTPDNRALVFLSASPTFLRSSLRNALVNINHFPVANFILKHWVAQFSTHDYKIHALNALSSRHSDPIILLGDDTEHDPEIFTEFARSQPGRVAAIYIRRNTMRDLPAGVIGHHSPFEVSLNELENGRLSAEDVEKVGAAVSNPDRDRELLFPSFYYCPETEVRDLTLGPIASAHPELVTLKDRVAAHYADVCSSRR